MSVTTAAVTDVASTIGTLQGILANEMAEQTAFVWDTVARTVSKARTAMGGTSYPTGSAGTADTIWIAPITASSTGHINEILVYASRSGNMKVAIYDTSGNLLGKAAAPYNFAAAGYAYIPLEAPVNCSSGTTYWLAAITDQAMLRYGGGLTWTSRSKAQEYDGYEWETALSGTVAALYTRSMVAYVNTYPAPSATTYANNDTEAVGEYLEGQYTKDLTALTPTYDIYYRFAAVVGHLWSYGDEFSFKPSPAQILPATDVYLDTATINGRLTEEATDWGFAWDTETREGANLLGSVEWDQAGSGVNNVYYVKQTASVAGVIKTVKVNSHEDGFKCVGIYADYLTGTCTAGTGAADGDDFDLIDSAGVFLATDVGKTIENTTDSTSTTIKHYVSATEIQVDDDIFVSTEGYKILARGEPGDRLAKKDTDGGWNTTVGIDYVDLESALTVTAATVYWVAFNCDTAASLHCSSATGLSDTRYKVAIYATFSFPTKAGTGFSTVTNGFSIAALIQCAPSDSDYTNSYEIGAGTYAAADKDHDLTSLTKNDTYYFRFAVKVGGRWYWSEEESFTTLNDMATDEATDVELYEAQLNGNIISVAGGTVTFRGFVWDIVTRENPLNTAPAASLYANNWTEAGDWPTGVFDHTPALTRYTTYFFRACYCIAGAWVYGDEKWVHTQSIKIVTGANNADYTFVMTGGGVCIPLRFNVGGRDWAILTYQDTATNGYKGGVGSNPYMVVWDYTTQAVVHGPIRVALNPEFTQGDAHGSNKSIIDANNKLHVFYGAHASAQMWTRSKLALTETNPFPNGNADDFETPKSAGFDATYATVGSDSNGDLWIAYRSGVLNQDLRVSVRKSTNWTGTWADASFGAASHISRDQTGSGWPWTNLECAANEDMIFTYLTPAPWANLYAIKWSESNSRWETIAGVEVTLPITTDTQASLLIQESQSITGMCVATDSDSNYFVSCNSGLLRYKSSAWHIGHDSTVGVYPQLNKISDTVFDLYGIAYPYTDPKYIYRIRSTDGGETFGAVVKVAALRYVSATAVGFFSTLLNGKPGSFVCEELLDDGTNYYDKVGQLYFQPLTPATTIAATLIEGRKATLNGRFEILTTATDYGWAYGKVSHADDGDPVGAPSASAYTSYFEKGAGTYTEGLPADGYTKQVTGLTGESTYYYRFAVKAYGTWHWGEELSFVTLEAAALAGPLFFAV